MARIVVVGEGMVELANAGGSWHLGFGGDTLNTAVHLARLGNDVGYLTALGDDPFSNRLRDEWRAEGIDPSLILTDAERRPGLYAITNDADGERSFTYWRGEAAARRMFALPESAAAVAAAADADLILFSMITLAILPPDGRETLLALAGRVRARGGRVAFDTNYRPPLWRDVAEARDTHRATMPFADIGLPTLEDEAALGVGDTVGAVLRAWQAAGVDEVVIKQGAAGCTVDGEPVPPPAWLAPVDTSGAGDAFNAGYLDARWRGCSPRAAAVAGHRLAGWTVMQRGAIPARTANAPYAALAPT